MKLEASHYDTIEWKPIAIDPGTFINKPEHTYKSKLGKKREIILKSPCRVDVGLIDYSALKFTDQNDYKAGEMSFACDVYTYVKVKLLNRSKLLLIVTDRQWLNTTLYWLKRSQTIKVDLKLRLLHLLITMSDLVLAQ